MLWNSFFIVDVGSQGDTSAYETMYEDDLMDPQTMPWLNPGYHDKINEEVRSI